MVEDAGREIMSLDRLDQPQQPNVRIELPQIQKQGHPLPMEVVLDLTPDRAMSREAVPFLAPSHGGSIMLGPVLVERPASSGPDPVAKRGEANRPLALGLSWVASLRVPYYLGDLKMDPSLEMYPYASPPLNPKPQTLNQKP